MIVFDLLCEAGHRFEGWFASAADYDAQREQGLLLCPICSSKGIERVPSATRFNSGAAETPRRPAGADPERLPRDPLAIAQILYSRMIDELLTGSEDVGSAFPEEARRIHRGEAPRRAIRGQATEEEHRELLDEGIPVLRLPIPPKERMS